MATLKIRDIKAALARKGFVSRDGDHEYFIFHCDGKKTSVMTKFSRSATEADDWLQSQVAKQIKLSKAQFIRFVECAMSANEYRALLIDGKHVVC